MTERRKTIIRVNHNAQPYFMVARSVAQNEAISYEALGLLCYLLSKPNDWEIQPKALAREHCGRDKAYRLIDELLKARHIERTAVKNERGRIVRVEYVVYESPLPESPDTVKPDMDNPDTEKAYIKEYRQEQSKEKTTKKETAVVVVADEPKRPDVFKAYEDAFGFSLTAMLADELKLLVEEYTEAWVIDAMRVAVTNGKRSLGYAKGVLRRWQIEGRSTDKPQLTVITLTPEQAAADDARREAERLQWWKEQGLA
jgi:DnaD/phage-associated family protein